MSPDWRDGINQRLGRAPLTHENFIKAGSESESSAIDEFYSRMDEIVIFATPELLTSKQFLGPLLLVGLVSAVEDYFRTIFCVCIRLCSISRSRSADQKIALGSAVWQRDGEIAKGALEHLSLADSQTIKLSSEKFLGFKIEKGSDVESALDEFDKICQLRHGIVHTCNRLPGTNALKLGLSSSHGPAVIAVEYAQLQEAALVCRSLITSYNLDLFILLSRRWAYEWNPSRDFQNFKFLWRSFYSSLDSHSGRLNEELTLIKCRNRVLLEFQ